MQTCFNSNIRKMPKNRSPDLTSFQILSPRSKYKAHGKVQVQIQVKLKVKLKVQVQAQAQAQEKL